LKCCERSRIDLDGSDCQLRPTPTAIGQFP
jgi:hypothetical protein